MRMLFLICLLMTGCASLTPEESACSSKCRQEGMVLDEVSEGRCSCRERPMREFNHLR